MRALIIGGYGYIGSHLAQKYDKEGISVCIIDNIVDGYYRKPKSNHKFYDLDFENVECKKYIKSKAYDIAVLVIDEYRLDVDVQKCNKHISSMMNLLHAIGESKVSKVLLLSTTQLYGNTKGQIDERTPTDIQDIKSYFYATCEQMCVNLSMYYGFDYCILRAPEVYGEYQNLSNGLVAKFLNAENNTVVTSPDQLFNVIYIGDLVEALYKASIYSNTPMINVVSDDLGSFSKVEKQIYYEKIQSAPLEQCLDISNATAKTALDWTPLYSFDRGFRDTVHWFHAYEAKGQTTLSKKQKAKSLLKLDKGVINTIENMMLFLVCIGLTFSDSALVGSLAIDFNLLYVIIIGSFFGIRQSVLASVLVSLLLLIQRLTVGVSIENLLVDFNSMMLILTYLSVGIGLGYVIENNRQKIIEKSIEVKAVNNEIENLQALYNENLDDFGKLEEKLLLYEDSSSKLSNLFMQFDSLQPDELMFSAVNAVHNTMKTKCTSLYLLAQNRQFLRFRTSSDDDKMLFKKSIDLVKYPSMQKMVQDRTVFVNSEMDFNLPSMMAPLIVDDEVVGILMVELNEITDHTLYRTNLFQIIAKVMNSSFSKAYAYENQIISEKYIQDTILLKEQYFQEKLDILTQMGKRNQIDYSILKIASTARNHIEVAHAVEKSIRNDDVLGVYNHEMCVVLNNTNAEEAKIVLERFNKMGIKTKLLQNQ